MSEERGELLVEAEAEPAGEAEQVPESVLAVLNLPKLLEMIMDYAMRDDDGEMHSKNGRNLRLVQKQWKETVSTVLWNNRIPLFHLRLTEYNSLYQSDYVQDNGNLLDRFVNLWKSIRGTRTGTIGLCIESDFFWKENYNSFKSFLAQCGTGLFKLEIDMPKNGGTLPGCLPNVDVSILNELTVFVGFKEWRDEDLHDEELDNSANMLLFLQLLINRNTSLNTLRLFVQDAPLNLRYLGLPPSITNLELDCSREDHESDMELLLNNQLPNLSSFTFYIKNTKDSKMEPLFRVLYKFRKTLRKLTLKSANNILPRYPLLVDFPAMEALEELTWDIWHLELPDNLSGQSLPKLKELVLWEQTSKMLSKWISGTPLSSVNVLALELVDETSDEENTLPINLETMQRVHLTFVNVRELILRISGTETDGLKYMFMEMSQLSRLTIIDCGNESIVNSDYWDSLLAGFPVGLIAGLRSSPSEWNGMELHPEGSEPSIKMLSELGTLSLVCYREGEPLISELAFIFAFRKMPKLQSIILKGRFLVKAASMTEGWAKKLYWGMRKSMMWLHTRRTEPTSLHAYLHPKRFIQKANEITLITLLLVLMQYGDVLGIGYTL